MRQHEDLFFASTQRAKYGRFFFRLVLLAVSILLVGYNSNLVVAQEAASKDKAPPASPLKFPGITIDLKRRLVDLEATICLDRGPLEVIACTEGTKEHESIVSVKVKPRHVHLGLLLIGAKNGKPAMRRRLKDGGKHPRWVDVPPSGDPIAVSLVFKDEAGKATERPIGDFVRRAANAGEERTSGAEAKASKDEADKPEEKFPDSFLFAGSHLIQNKEGKTQYLADLQGNVISVATFGDEVLCLPGYNSKENAALEWEANPKTLPKVGTRVTLRLRPKAVPQGDGSQPKTD